MSAESANGTILPLNPEDAYKPISVGLFVTLNGAMGAAPAGKADRYAARRLGIDVFKATY
jgi:hypothetical protein